MILFLVAVGLVYEGVIRIDRRPRLPKWLHWAASLAVVTVAVVLTWQLLYPYLMDLLATVLA